MKAVGVKTGGAATDLKRGDILQYKDLGLFSIETDPELIGTKITLTMVGDVGGFVNTELGASDWVIFYRK